MDLLRRGVDRVSRTERKIVDRVPGRKEFRPDEPVTALQNRDPVITAGHVEVLVTSEQVIDLMPDNTRRPHEHLVQTDAADHGVAMLARVVVSSAEDLRR